MSIKVYLISGSAPAWRVLLCLEHKGLPYQTQVLQTSKKQQKESWFLELNPRGQIPLLIDSSQDSDLVVSESLAILHFLEAKYPEPNIFGESAVETARIEQGVHEILNYTDTAVTDFVQPVFRNKIDSIKNCGTQIADKIHSELAILESKLNQGQSQDQWVFGQFSACDIVLIPTMQRLLRAIGKAPDLASELNIQNLENLYPRLWAWNARAESLAAFDRSFPPHWRESN